MSMLDNIPPSRLALYLMVLGLLPIVFALMAVRGSLSEVNATLDQIDSLKQRVVLKETKEAFNVLAQQYYRDVNPLYIEKEIESLSLLDNEISGLKKAVNNPDFMVDDRLRRRLQFLTSGQNKLVLNEGAVQNYGLFQEVIETTAAPIEVDRSDVKKILEVVEGVSTPLGGQKPPQLIVLDFRLERKQVWEDYDVLSLSIKLLKRDYTPAG